MSKSKKGKIGPHEGKEIELMLEGKKPLSFFRIDSVVQDLIDKYGFEKHVESGILKKFVKKFTDDSEDAVLYCLPTEEWRAKIFMMTLDYDSFKYNSGMSTVDINRLEGFLLGYSKEDVEAFIKHRNS